MCERGLRNPRDRNARNNVSILVRFRDRKGKTRCVMIDAGKTMRTTALRWFPRAGITGIDAVVLTHGHADAMGGLDDLRDLQPASPIRDAQGRVVGRQFGELPIYCNRATYDVCAQTFPYLIRTKHADTEAKEGCKRRVAALDWRCARLPTASLTPHPRA